VFYKAAEKQGQAVFRGAAQSKVGKFDGPSLVWNPLIQADPVRFIRQNPLNQAENFAGNS